MSHRICVLAIVALAAHRAGATPPPSVTQNFLAVADDTTANPPDPSGAVGPNHVVAIASTGMVVHSKTGVRLAGPTPLASVFTGHTTYRDPRALYLPGVDRFVLAAAADPSTATSSVVIATSKTADPTGTYSMLDLPTGGTVWAGFVQLGFNATWLVVTADLFAVADNTYVGSRVWACDRAAVIAGTATTCTALDRPAGAIVPAQTYDATATEYLLDAGDPQQATVRVFALTGAIGAETLALLGPVTLPTGAWAGTATPSNNGFAPQSGSPTKLATLDGRVRSAIVRDGRLWGAQTIYLPSAAPSRTAVQWFELDPIAKTAIQAGRIDDPTGATFYAYPSIAVNAAEDMFVGYARFSTTTFASAGYTVKFHNEPARDPAIAVQGAGTYVKLEGGPLNQWGRYSATAIDPSGLGFWTLQEVAGVPAAGCAVDCGRWKLQWSAVALSCALETCIAADECHLAGTCDELAGCSNPSASDGTPCSLGVCTAGVCTAPIDGAGDDAGVDNPVSHGGGCCRASEGDATGSLVIVFACAVRRRRRRQ